MWRTIRGVDDGRGVRGRLAKSAQVRRDAFGHDLEHGVIEARVVVAATQSNRLEQVLDEARTNRDGDPAADQLPAVGRALRLHASWPRSRCSMHPGT